VTAAEFVFRFSEPATGNSLTEHLSYDGEVLKQRVEAPATFRPVLGGASDWRWPIGLNAPIRRLHCRVSGVVMGGAARPQLGHLSHHLLFPATDQIGYV